MSLKPSMFDSSPLPFSLQYGHVSKIFIKIPIWDMFKSPLVIQVSDVFGVVKFKPFQEWDKQQQIQAFQQANQDELEQFELYIKNNSLLSDEKHEVKSSFSDKLIARILDNLQVSVKNVYFRFEDNMNIQSGHLSESNIQEKFSLGFKLKEFQIQTTDQNYQAIDTKKKSNSNIQEDILTFKTAKINGFSIFCDWDQVDLPENGGLDFNRLQKESKDKVFEKHSYFHKILNREFQDQGQNKYILKDFKIELRLQINKDVRNPLMPASLDYPQLKAQVLIGNQTDTIPQIIVYQPQILRILKTVEFIGIFNEFREGSLKEICESKLTSQEKEIYSQTFFQFHTQKKDQENLKQILLSIENKVTVNHIIDIRNLCHSQLRCVDDRSRALDQIEEQIKKEIGKEISFFTSAQKKQEITANIRQKYAEQIEEVNLQYENQDQYVKSLIDEFKDADQEAKGFDQLPQDYITCQFIGILSNLEFIYINEYDSILFKMGIKGFQTDFAMAKKFVISGFRLKDIWVEDCWSGSERWPKVVNTSEKDKKYVLVVSFESNKDFKECPFHLDVKVQKSIFLVMSVPLFLEVARSLKKAMNNQKFDFEYFAQLAKNSLIQFQEQIDIKKIKKGEYKHNNYSLKADIHAPVFIIPQDIFEMNSTYVKLDLGQITIQSQLLEYQKTQDYKLIQDPHALYDIYSFELKNLNLQFINENASDPDQIDSKLVSEIKIIKNISFAISLKNCLEPLHPDSQITSFCVEINFSEQIEINFESGFSLIKQIYEMKESIIIQLNNMDYQEVEDNLKKLFIPAKSQPNLIQGIINDQINQVRQKQLEQKEKEITEQLQSQEEWIEGKGTDLSINIRMNSFNIVFGTSVQHNFVFLISNLGLIAYIQNNSFQIKFNLQKAEINEVLQNHNADIFNKILFFHTLSSAETSNQIQVQIDNQKDLTFFKNYPDQVVKSNTFVTITVCQSILLLNLSTQARLFDQVYQFFEFYNTPFELQEQRKQRQDAFIALSPEQQKTRKTTCILNQYINLAKEFGGEGILECIREMLDDLGGLIQKKEVDCRLEVFRQDHLLDKYQIQINIKQIEVWFSDYPEGDNFKNVPLVLQFKFKFNSQINLDSFIKSLVCTRLSEEKKFTFQKQTLIVEKIIEQNNSLIFDLESITIKQNIFDSWLSANVQILDQNGQNFVQINMLDPVNLSINFQITEQMNLDQVSQLYIDFSDMNLSFDFKDIHMIWQFYLRYQQVLEPQIGKIVEQNEENFEKIVQRFKVNLEKNFGKSFVDNTRDSQLFSIGDDYQSEFKMTQGEGGNICWKLIIGENDPRYQEATCYKKGDLILEIQNPEFRKQIFIFDLKVKQVLLEFCDGDLETFFKSTDEIQNVPLLCLKFKKFEIKMHQNEIDLHFNPLEGLKINQQNLITETQEKFYDIELPNYLYINADFQLEATYFNQITQHLEPFIEPWLLSGFILQETKTSLFNIQINSEKFLNINVTFGMAKTLHSIKQVFQKLLKNNIDINLSQTKAIQQPQQNNNQIMEQKLTVLKTFKEKKYKIINDTWLDISIINSRQPLLINQKSSQIETILISGNVLGNFCRQTLDSNLFYSNERPSLQTEEEAIKIDFNIDQYQFKNVPISNNGVYGYYSKKTKSQNQLAIIIEISSQGTQRVIKFMSQLIIQNTIGLPICLEFQFVQKEDQNPQEMWIVKKETVVIEQDDSFSVPLNWFALVSKNQNIKLDCFFVQQFTSQDEQNFPLFQDITRNFVGNERWVSEKVLQMQNLRIESESWKSKILQIKEDQNICLEIQGKKCLPENTDQNNPIQFSILFSPPLIIQNKTMMNFKISQGTHQGQNLCSEIPPGMCEKLFWLNIAEVNFSFLKFQFQDNGLCDSKEIFFKIYENFKEHFVMSPSQGINKKQNIGQFTEIFMSSSGSQINESDNLIPIQIECSKRSLTENSNRQNKADFLQRQTILNNSLALQLNLFIKYVIVNKSQKELFVQDQKIKGRSSKILSLNEKQTKIKLQARNFKQSNDIDLNQIGMSGVLTLDSNENWNTKQLQFGISISLAPDPFERTVILTIVPRYMIVNKLQNLVYIRQFKQQMGLEEKVQNIFISHQKINGEPSVMTEIHFDTLKEKSQKHEIQNKIQIKLQENQVLERSNADFENDGWTLPFSIDQMDDFQTQLEVNQAITNESNNNWSDPSPYTNFKKFIRVIITPNEKENDASLLIILENPALEEFIIKNKSPVPIEIYKYHKVKKTILDQYPLVLDPGSVIAFAWDNRDIIDKQLLIRSVQGQGIASLDQVSKYDFLKKKLIPNNLFKMKVLSVNQKTNTSQEKEILVFSYLKIDKASTKVLQIQCDNKQMKGINEQENQIEEKQIKLKKTGYNLKIDLKGIGISLIENRELLYIQLNDFLLDLKIIERDTKIKNQILQQEYTDLQIKISDFQIDSYINEEVPVLFCNKNIYNKLNTKGCSYLVNKFKSFGEVKEQKMPFLVIKIKKNEKKHENKLGSIIQYEEIHLGMQEFMFNIDTSILIKISKLFFETATLFDLGQPRFVCDGDVVDKSINEICPCVYAKDGVYVDEQQINVKKISFNVIMIGMVKCILNFKFDRTKIQQVQQIYGSGFSQIGKIIYFAGPWLQNFITLTDTQIQFNELIILESFISEEALFQRIKKHYKQQLKKQVFRILGSSNLLGNPAGFIDKAGLGIYEMARDPIVGMQQGPQAFVKGMGTGMQGLVKGFVGGSFQSFGNLTGSLYSVVKQGTGQEDTRSIQKAENIKDGFKQGILGFGSEIFSGVKGLVQKPAQGAKSGGFFGLMKGVGKGVVGAVATPAAGVLRAGESISQGISGTATKLGNYGKDQVQLLDPRTIRIRECRRVDLEGRIFCYDQNLALINYYLSKIEPNSYQNQIIRYYELLPLIDQHGNILENQFNVLLITTDYLILFDPINFQQSKKQKHIKAAVKIFENLNDIFDYNVTISPEYYQKNKQTGCMFLSLLFYKKSIQNIQEISEADQEKIIDKIIFQEDKDEVLRESIYFEENKQSISDQFYLVDFSQINHTQKQQVISNTTLSQVCLKIEPRLILSKLYDKILQSQSSIQINSVVQHEESIMFKLFQDSDPSHMPNTIENQSEVKQIVNPKNSIQKIQKLIYNSPQRIILFSDKFSTFDNIFNILDQYVQETRENVTVLQQLKKEAYEFKKGRASNLEKANRQSNTSDEYFQSFFQNQ